MDLKSYYAKVRDVSGKLTEDFPVVVSLETADGGKKDVLTEVSRALAAKMVVDGSVRLAKPDEAEAYREAHAEARRAAAQAAEAAKMQFTVLTLDDLKALKE